MADQSEGRIAIDDIVESTTNGVLRALEARNVGAPEFIKENGFFVKIDITCGGYPGPIEKVGVGRVGPVAEPGG